MVVVIERIHHESYRRLVTMVCMMRDKDRVQRKLVQETTKDYLFNFFFFFLSMKMDRKKWEILK